MLLWRKGLAQLGSNERVVGSSPTRSALETRIGALDRLENDEAVTGVQVRVL